MSRLTGRRIRARPLAARAPVLYRDAMEMPLVPEAVVFECPTDLRSEG
jgi:hypothetical protein